MIMIFVPVHLPHTPSLIEMVRRWTSTSVFCQFSPHNCWAPIKRFNRLPQIGETSPIVFSFPIHRSPKRVFHILNDLYSRLPLCRAQHSKLPWDLRTGATRPLRETHIGSSINQNCMNIHNIFCINLHSVFISIFRIIIFAQPFPLSRVKITRASVTRRSLATTLYVE